MREREGKLSRPKGNKAFTNCRYPLSLEFSVELIRNVEIQPRYLLGHNSKFQTPKQQIPICKEDLDLFKKRYIEKKQLAPMANQFAGKWLVFGIDLITIAVSFFLAYLLRFNLSMNFDVSDMIWQLPLILLFGAIAFLISGSHKGEFRYSVMQDIYTCFTAIFLSSILLILFVILIRNLEVFSELMIPLSIIILYGMLAFIGLTISRLAYKVFFHAPVSNGLK